MNKFSYPDDITEKLAHLEARQWSNYGLDRIYFSRGLTFRELGATCPYDMPAEHRFYLDLKTMSWHLTGEPHTDAYLVKHLNRWAGLHPEVSFTTNIRVSAVRHTAVESDDETDYDLSQHSDNELISLILDDEVDGRGENPWVKKIAKQPGLSERVIRACFAHRSPRQTSLILELSEQQNFPSTLWFTACHEEKFQSSNDMATWNRAIHSDDPALLDFIARNTKSVSVRDAIGSNPATSYETLMFLKDLGAIPLRLLASPETPDEVIAEILHAKAEGQRLKNMARALTSFGPKTIDALCDIHSHARVELVKVRADFITPAILERFARNANSELAIAIMQHPKVREETVRRYMRDGRSSIRTIAERAIRKWDNAPW